MGRVICFQDRPRCLHPNHRHRILGHRRCWLLGSPRFASSRSSRKITRSVTLHVPLYTESFKLAPRTPVCSPVCHDAFDGDGIGPTINGPHAAATHRAFKGQSDARGTNGLVRMGMLFSSLPFPSFFFLSVLPFERDSRAGILATHHYQARMITVKYPYPDLEEDQSNVVERTPPVRHLHPSIRARAAHTAYSTGILHSHCFFFSPHRRCQWPPSLWSFPSDDWVGLPSLNVSPVLSDGHPRAQAALVLRSCRPPCLTLLSPWMVCLRNQVARQSRQTWTWLTFSLTCLPCPQSTHHRL